MNRLPARAGRRAAVLTAVLTAVTLVAGSLATAPAATAAPAASAVPTTASAASTVPTVSTASKVKTRLTIKKIATRTAPYKKKVTVRPNVTRSGKVSVKSKTLTVAQHGKHLVKNKKKVALKAGTYRVKTKVTYRTYALKGSSGAKVWSKYKVKTKSQKLVVKQGKKPSSTAPVSKYHCPKWAPVKGNQSGIYHVPGGRWYKVTTPERCFVSASAARKAGYRASKNG